ncbi:hypothetical protein HWV07_05320 [Natronomonas salina]|uniref:hypothetical protein n=1 Tax=Natronomonas salina TaxID=1710540 RepID=UPI0015B6EA06|nr:hypothetical protein [Natronomonas salina]QLD88483.1 hypothetical protein HWV07_05320 [Natronomonas salina]
MRVTTDAVVDEYEWIRGRAAVPELINDVRDRLGPLFDTEVDHVTTDRYREEVDEVFADGDRAVNVAALSAILRDLDCEGDYPGFVVDEFLGRKLAATVAGGEPRALLAEATFHFADVHTHGPDDEAAGADDLDAALAAGFQSRLPGWAWTESESPFAVE